MSDLSSKYKAFSKVMSVYFKSKEIYGLIIYHNDEYTKVPVYNEMVTVPILKIKNPNNIPFSYYALIDLLDEELKTVEEYKKEMSELEGTFVEPVNIERHFEDEE